MNFLFLRVYVCLSYFFSSLCGIYCGNYPSLLEIPVWWSAPFLKLCLYYSLDFFIACPHFILGFINLDILFIMIRVHESCLIKGSKDQFHVSLSFLLYFIAFSTQSDDFLISPHFHCFLTSFCCSL